MFLYYRSVLNPNYPVAEVGEFLVVGHYYKSLMELVAELEEQVVEFLAVFGVKVS